MKKPLTKNYYNYLEEKFFEIFFSQDQTINFDILFESCFEKLSEQEEFSNRLVLMSMLRRATIKKIYSKKIIA